MSNALAIATVTGALQSRFNSLLIRERISGASVFVDHPSSEARTDGIYLKLFRMEPNSSLRNGDLPTRDATGALALRPRLALNLHYLMSFVGARGTLTSEHLAGLVALDLHLRPVLTPTEIQDFLEVTEDPILSGSDLAGGIERVRITPLPLDNEQLARIWGLFNQSFFSLTCAYEVSLVLLQPPSRPAAPKPVARAETYVLPMGSPRIAEVRSSSMAQPVVSIGEDLMVRGSNLRGPTTWLRLGRTQLRPVDELSIGADAITFEMTEALGLRAGVMAVQVVHRLDVDPALDRESYREIAVSNAVAFALVPTVTPVSEDAVREDGELLIRLVVTPAPAEGQEVELVLDRVEGEEHAAFTTFVVEDEDEDGVTVTVFTVTGLASGRWFCRVRIDDVVSLPRIDGGTYSLPVVNVP